MANCTYSVPDLDTSGDDLYGPRICNQSFIDWVWTTHGFNGDYWGDGWGFDDCCNNTKPLSRTFSGFWLLNYSADDYNNEDWNNDILHWGRRYVREQLHALNDLRAQCGDGTANATTFDAGCAHYRDTSYNACDEWDKDSATGFPAAGSASSSPGSAAVGLSSPAPSATCSLRDGSNSTFRSSIPAM